MDEALIETRISWKNEGEDVYVMGYFEDTLSRNIIKLHSVNEKEKSVSILLKPGVYLYKYLVDDREIIELSQKIQIENGEQFNVLTVDDKNLISNSLHNENFKTSTKLQNNTNFSILDDKYISHSLENIEKESLKQRLLNCSFRETIMHKPNQSCCLISKSRRGYVDDSSIIKHDITDSNQSDLNSCEEIPLEISQKFKRIDKKSKRIPMTHSEEMIYKETHPYPIPNILTYNSENDIKYQTLPQKNISRILNLENEIRNNSQIILNSNFPHSNIIQNRFNNLQECSGNFSMNLENNANNNLDTHINYSDYQNEEDTKPLITFDELENDYVIIFKQGDEFYVPMKVISLNTESGEMRLQYFKNSCLQDEEEEKNELVLNKNTIYYEKLAMNALEGIENLVLLDEVNSLSLMKNFQKIIENNKNIFLVQDILILISDRARIEIDDEGENELSFDGMYEVTEWYDNKVYLNNCDNCNQVVTLIKNQNEGNDKKNKNPQFQIFKEIMKIKNPKLYCKNENIIELISSLIEKINFNFYFFCSFSVKYRNHFNFCFIPILPTENDMMQMKTKSILKFSENKKINKKLIENLKHRVLSLLNFDKLPSQMKILFLEISTETIEKNFELVEIIYNITHKLNLKENFKHMFNLLILNNFFLNFTSYENKAKIFTNISQKYNKEIYIFYSNVILIHLFIFIFEMISVKFMSDINQKILDQNKFSFLNFLLLYEADGKNSIHGKDNLFSFSNDSIFNKISDRNDQNFLYESFQSRLNDFLISSNDFFESDTFNTELEIIKELEDVFDLELFGDFYKNKKVEKSLINYPTKMLKALDVSLRDSISKFQIFENKGITLKQIWLYTFNNFSDFSQIENNVTNFVYKNKFLDYIKLYQDSNFFFVEYTLKNFFQKFLPILTDIDAKFNPIKKYKNILSEFINHLQTFEDYTENFVVSDSHIKLNYLTYSILQNILRNLLEEKVILIQKNFKGRNVSKFITTFRANIKIIQRKWRKYRIEKFQFENVNDCVEYIWSKYKDPILVKIFCNLNKSLSTSECEKIKMNDEIEKIKNTNILLDKNVLELKMKINSQEKENGCLNMTENNLLGTEMKNKLIEVAEKINSNTSRSQNDTAKTKSIKLINESHKIVEAEEAKRKLESTLNNYKYKYKDLVKVVNEHEKKIEKFVDIINTNQEIKSVLEKYGIKIN